MIVEAILSKTRTFENIAMIERGQTLRVFILVAFRIAFVFIYFVCASFEIQNGLRSILYGDELQNNEKANLYFTRIVTKERYFRTEALKDSQPNDRKRLHYRSLSQTDRKKFINDGWLSFGMFGQDCRYLLCEFI